MLDGVRALACLSVIAYHVDYFTFHSGVWTPAGVGPLTSSLALVGWSGVTLFFILSGFLLFMPYAKAILFDTPWPSARFFYLRRVLRIFPGYYTALILLILLAYPVYLQVDHLKQTGLFLTFLMDSSPKTYQQIDGPFWTLAIEWQFYMLLPLLAYAFRRIAAHGTLRKRLWLLTSCLIGLIIWGIATRAWGRSFVVNPGQTPLLPPLLHKVAIFFLYGSSGKYLEDFAVGMLVSVCYVLSKNATVGERVKANVGRASLWLWGVGVLWLFVMATWDKFPALAFLNPYFGAHNWLCELGFASGFGLCMTAILFGPASLKYPFEWGPLRWVGLISYSLYIWHIPILLFFMSHVLPYFQGWRHSAIYGLYWLCVLLVVFPFSYLVYRAIEQPWIHLSDKMRKARLAHSSQAS